MNGRRDKKRIDSSLLPAAVLCPVLFTVLLAGCLTGVFPRVQNRMAPCRSFRRPSGRLAECPEGAVPFISPPMGVPDGAVPFTCLPDCGVPEGVALFPPACCVSAAAGVDDETALPLDDVEVPVELVQTRDHDPCDEDC